MTSGIELCKKNNIHSTTPSIHNHARFSYTQSRGSMPITQVVQVGHFNIYFSFIFSYYIYHFRLLLLSLSLSLNCKTNDRIDSFILQSILAQL